MNQVTVVRIYLSEDEPQVKDIFEYLHHQKVMGATQFRGVKGFGSTGVTRESSLLDWHFDLPVVIEFFDESSKVETLLQSIRAKVQARHILTWPAQML